MKIFRPRTDNITDPSEKRWTESLYKIFNRNISYGSSVNAKDQNIYGKMVVVSDTGLANTEFVVEHNLGQVPNFFDVKNKNLAGDVYASSTAWTKTKAFFKASTAHMTVTLFIH